MAVVIELTVPSIEDESTARPIVEFLAELPGFDPVRYDLNQRGSWRGWNVELAIVDLLTQRTQLFIVEGEGGKALVATGKHGETPTIAIEGPVSASGIDPKLYASLSAGSVRFMD